MHTLIVDQVIDLYTIYQRKKAMANALKIKANVTCLLDSYQIYLSESKRAEQETEEALATLLCSIEQLKSIK